MKKYKAGGHSGKTGSLTIGNDNYRLMYNDNCGTYTSLDKAKSDLLNYFLNSQTLSSKHKKKITEKE